MKNRAPRRAVLSLAVVALVATACGGGGGGDSDDARPASTTTTVQDIAADLASARASVLRLTDFPDGWVEEPNTSDGGDPDVNAELAACMEVDPELMNTPDNPTNVETPNFVEPESGASVSNSIAFTESLAKAKQVMGIFAKPQLPDCLATVMTTLMTRQAPSGMAFGTVDVKRLALQSDADETVAIRVSIPIETEGISIVQYLDMVVLHVGRAGVTVTFSNTNSVVPSDFEERIVGTVVDRLRGAPDADRETDPATSVPDATPASGVRSLALSTDGERAALQAAMTDEGRRWAAGNASGNVAAAGTPVLGGYVVTLDDGTTQHQLKVLDGQVVPFFGATGLLSIDGRAGNNPTISPQSTQQTSAVAAAKRALAATAPAATSGGIELYVFYFPPSADGAYPHVAVYADSTVGTFAMGGPELR